MVEEATVDAYDEGEQVTGWLTMLEENLELPFDTEVLGVRVAVVEIDQREDHSIVAVCTRGKQKQAIALVDLPLPTPPPAGAEWVAAYRHWLGQR
ncbi:MAG: calcium-binding protein [Polyangiales bacterium]